MRYITIVKGPENLAASGPAPTALFEEVGRLLEEGLKSGKIVSFGGLKPTASGTRMRITNGKIVTTDGPFTEAKEVIGGFTIYDVASKEELLEEANRFMELHRRLWPKWEGEIEIRQMFEEEDDIQAEQIEGSRAVESGRR